MDTTLKLTKAQQAALDVAKREGEITSLYYSLRTLKALEDKGLLIWWEEWQHWAGKKCHRFLLSETLRS